MLFSLLALPVLVAGLPSPESKRDNTLHFPLRRQTTHRRGGPVDVSGLARSVDALRAKYGFAVANKVERRASQADISLIDQVKLALITLP